jgi:uncharacterized protein YnzC (UPF0291/DUF896 family)
MRLGLIDRINELSRLSKERELTAEEQAERTALRAEYVKEFRAQTRQLLDNTVVQYPDGSKKSVKEHNGK